MAAGVLTAPYAEIDAFLVVREEASHGGRPSSSASFRLL